MINSERLSGRASGAFAPKPAAVYIAVLAALASPAFAADSADTIPDVTVTAQHKEESLQKTPIAISAFSEQQLEDQGIDSVRDLAGRVPNLNMPRASISYSTQTYSLRGIGESDPIQESAVAVYADDLYIPRAISSMLDFNDVQQVEVLRGPQGTLYGRNSSAGAVRVITADPDETTRGYVQVSGGNYNAANLRALVSGPIKDDVLFGSASIIRLTRDGTSWDPTRGQDVNNVDITAFRGKLRAKPDEQWDVQLTINALVDRSDTTSYTPRNQGPGTYNPYLTLSSLSPENGLNQGSAVLRAIDQINDHLQFKSVTAYSAFNQPVDYDNSGQAAVIQQNLIHYKQHYFTQEFQLNGNYDRFDFSTGLFFYHENFLADRNNNTYSVASNKVSRFGEYSTTVTDSVALYGQGDYKITDQWRATLGLRFTEEKKDFDYSHLFLNAQQQVTGTDFQTSDNHRWSSFTPKIGVDYQWTPVINQYAYIARGFKAGGYDNRAPSALAATTPFSPETVTTYETGVKSDWLNRKLRVNADVFYNDYSDLQATALDPSTGVSQRFNAAGAHTWGVELETSARPVTGLSISANVAYLHAVYDDFVNAGGAGTNAAGKDLTYSPTWNASAAIGYVLPISSLPGAWKVNADIQFQTSSYANPMNTDPFKIPTQKFINANTSYTSADGHWVTTFSVSNLLNDAFVQSASYTPGTTANYANYNAPRTFLLSEQYNF
ncbi:TonB-dependent receptor [Amantichitinum ursilacus]|uniref:Pesticin receptor n=1 Tax=Amantichitinum ursilacus TaxID=857265 RepID=A0A0N0GR19_9NEIS|nr:TonB-dependent receptor [Amantichitinum ursilacus]KPC55029.1 Pesticin receptor precursor [Amantichitinum ursilacus]